MSGLEALAVLLIVPAIGSYIGFDLAFRFMRWRVRAIVLDELDEYHVRQAGPLMPDQEARMRRNLKLDRTRFSALRRVQSDA